MSRVPYQIEVLKNTTGLCVCGGGGGGGGGEGAVPNCSLSVDPRGFYYACASNI